MSNKATWLSYEFHIFTPDTTWNDIGGVYIFAGVNHHQRKWVPLYIGETNSFANRLPRHERWTEALRAGATHLHLMVVPQEATRRAIEARLIQVFRPRLNDLLK